MKIVVVDDDQLVVASLRIILEADAEIEVIGTGHSGKAAIQLYKDLKPDILLMDIRMGEMSGIEAGTEILSNFHEAKILYLTTFSDDEYIVEALRIGSKGYLLKQNFDSIIPSLKAVDKGQNVFGDEIITKIPSLMQQSIAKGQGKSPLTPKELEIVTQVANGLNNKEIAEALYLSEGTVRNYISTILEKLELRDRTQLAIYYYKQGL